MTESRCLHVSGCTKPQKYRGLCKQHYNQHYHSGLPMPLPTRGEKIRQFFADALRSETDECIDWPFCMSGAGYGQIWRDGKMRNAHREICSQVYGRRSSDVLAAHACNNRKCINPRHLRWATPSENQLDRIIHGTDGRGESNPTAKLTASAVRDIRRSRGKITQFALAERYGVSQVKISQVQLGKCWTHVK